MNDEQLDKTMRYVYEILDAGGIERETIDDMLDELDWDAMNEHGDELKEMCHV